MPDFVDDYLSLKRRVKGMQIRNFSEPNVLDLAPYLSEGFAPDYYVVDSYLHSSPNPNPAPPLCIVRDGDICTMYGMLLYEPNMTPADVAAGENFQEVTKSHWYGDASNVFGTTYGNTVGKNSPRVTLAGSSAGAVGTPDQYIPPDFCPLQSQLLTVPFNWQNSSSGATFGGITELDYSGRSVQLFFSNIYNFDHTVQGGYIVCNDPGPQPEMLYTYFPGGDVVRGIPGDGFGTLHLDGITYRAGLVT